jgi:hypothetical protein
MVEKVKQQWRKFRSGRPGHRFQERYEKNRRTRSSQSWFVRLLKPAAAIVLFAAGVVLCFIPGPGLPLIVIGAGLLGDECRPIAQGMDWLELRLRKIVTWGRRWWDRAPKLARHAVIVVAVMIAGGAAYGGYRFIASH